jgi:uncharacterized protein DUF1670
MNCSQFEAKAILNAVYETYQPFFDNSGAMKPGQVLFEVVSIENGAQKKLSECKMLSVILTLDAGEEDLQVREHQGVQGLRRQRLERIVNEAFQQGGLLTVEDIANRLLNCGEHTVCRDIKTFKDQASLRTFGAIAPVPNKTCTMTPKTAPYPPCTGKVIRQTAIIAYAIGADFERWFFGNR